MNTISPCKDCKFLTPFFLPLSIKKQKKEMTILCTLCILVIVWIIKCLKHFELQGLKPSEFSVTIW